MIEQERDNGKFAAKGSELRTVRSIRATDSTWNALEDKASEQDMTKADYLEALVSGEIEWESDDSDKDQATESDFDIEEVVEILTEALTLKSNAGGKIKTEIKRALEMMGFEIEAK
jgi:hypothetical protein